MVARDIQDFFILARLKNNSPIWIPAQVFMSLPFPRPDKSIQESKVSDVTSISAVTTTLWTELAL
ncbi:unnamed protein product [Diplocarpon coronariae]